MNQPKRALLLLFDGIEEIEAVTPVDILRRAGVEVTTAATGASLHVKGRSGIGLTADALLTDVAKANFDLLVIPGGPGVSALREPGVAAGLAQKFATAGKMVAAICAAPVLLHDAGLLQGRRYTAHFSVQVELATPETTEPVVRDGNIITSRGAGTALEFSLTLAALLTSQEKASEISSAIMV